MVVTKQNIANRFNLIRPFAQEYSEQNTHTWLGRDTILSNPVRIVLFNAQTPNLKTILTTAHKAALFSDEQNVNIRSIIDDGEYVGICTEVPEGEPLNRYLEKANLPAQTVVAIIGILATVINRANRAGLYHLQLQAKNIYLTPDGNIKLDGLAILAALVGADTSMPETLKHNEIRGLTVFLASLLQGKDFPENPATHDEIISKAIALPNLPESVTDVLKKEKNNEITDLGQFARLLAPWEKIETKELPQLDNVFIPEKRVLTAEIKTETPKTVKKELEITTPETTITKAKDLTKTKSNISEKLETQVNATKISLIGFAVLSIFFFLLSVVLLFRPFTDNSPHKEPTKIVTLETVYISPTTLNVGL